MIVVLALVVALTVPGSAVSASAQEEAETEQSPWGGPWNPTIPHAEVERFVGLWSARVVDERWMASYLAGDSVPGDVLGEGFHSLDTHTKIYLVHRLFERLVATVPELGASVADLQQKGDVKAIEHQKDLLYLFVFEKQWVKDLKNKAESRSDVPVQPSPESPLDSVIEAMREVPPIDIPVGALPSSLAFPQVNTQDAELSAPEIPALPEPPSLRFALPSIEAMPPGSYKVCQESPSGSGCSVPVPVGTPAPVDLTGDSAPDVIALLAPDAAGVPSPGLAYKLRRLETAPVDLPAHVSVVTDLPSAGHRLSVGFNGRSSRLARESNASFGIKDVAAAMAGNIDMGLVVDHVEPGSKSGITFGFSRLTPGGSAVEPGTADPIKGSLEFTRVPAKLTANLSLHRGGGRDDYTVHVSSTEPSTFLDANVSADSSSGGSRRELKATVDRLPSDVKIGFVREPMSGITTVGYNASAAINAFTYSDVSTPVVTQPGNKRELKATVLQIPKDLHVTYDPSKAGVVRLAYRSTTAVPAASGSFNEFASGRTEPVQSVSATVNGIPTAIDALVDMSARQVAWSASEQVASLAVGARIPVGGRVWDGALTITGAPKQWKLGFAAGRPRFEGVSGPIGSVTATLTNHGSFTTFAGNHLSVVYRSVSDDFDASFRMSNISLVDFEKRDSGFSADLRVGGGNRFTLNGDVVIGGTTKAFANVVLDPLPLSIQLTQAGENLFYTGSQNFNLNLYGEVGNLGAVANTQQPPIPTPAGVSVRDGRGCVGTACGTAVKARLVLLGAPTGISVTPSGSGGPKVQLTNFNPPAGSNQLVVDADLLEVTSPRTKITALQSGIPGGVSFTFGPISTETLNDGSKRTSVSYSSSPSGLGPLTAEVERGSDWGRLELSNIPMSVTAAITAGKVTSTVQSALGQPVSHVKARFRRTGDVSALAGVDLFDVPTAINSLSFGRISKAVGTGDFTVPGLSYRANASTLSFNAFVDAALMGGDVRARVVAGASKLGASTDAHLEDSGRLRMVSAPGTDSLEVRTWGSIRSVNNFTRCQPACNSAFRLEQSGHANVDRLNIDDLKLKVTGLKDVGVRLGISSGIEGAYNTFEFGWGSITVNPDIEAHAKACVLWWCATLVSFTWHPGTIPVNVLFQLGVSHWSRWADITTPIPCGPWWNPWSRRYHVVVDINPHPHGNGWNAFVVSSASAEGAAWVVTPNPMGIIPGFAMDVVQAATSPFGGGLRGSFPCV